MKSTLLLLFCLLFLLPVGFAHEVKIIPIDEDLLLPIFTPDEHLTVPSEPVDFDSVAIGESSDFEILITNPSTDTQSFELALDDPAFPSLGFR